MTIAVLGATGGQGGAVVTALLEAGRAVRAVVRDPGSGRARALAAAGAEVVPGDLFYAASLAEAFRGATAAFAVTTPFQDGLDAEVAQGAAIVRAAADAALPHLVLASVASADRGTGIPHFETKARTEELLADSGLPATVVAPTYFYDNALGVPDEVAAGLLTMALPGDTPLQQVARQDLGRVVAEIVADPDRWTGQRIEVAGDDPTPVRMAAEIGRAAGGTVEFRQTPLEDLRATSPDMFAMFSYLADTGYQVDLAALRAQFPGVPWTSYGAWAATQEWPTPRG
ncbi:NmrA family NAD(P)-binding protein [Streptomyces sp. JH14]|uniref:NmrA family NAD(P)-binding protein n=1 Tax=Streptomyces sp. JH14 TaxID=2793630 RepID=UPI0023F9EFF2|nr:NmrA family NAD(P)-binding protein [Streptomyces sp. JH14]MDF6045033.1 NmrA family NAD(P)-binding protein [Streptomyces sp. JH14]